MSLCTPLYSRQGDTWPIGNYITQSGIILTMQALYTLDTGTLGYNYTVWDNGDHVDTESKRGKKTTDYSFNIKILIMNETQ